MQIFEVLADPVRRRILELLAPREMASGEVVEVIGAEFGITQAAVSQHLKVLRESGFATVRAEAQRRLYSVDVAGLRAVDAWIDQFRNFWEPKLDALATEIARGKRERRNAPMTKTEREEGLINYEQKWREERTVTFSPATSSHTVSPAAPFSAATAAESRTYRRAGRSRADGKQRARFRTPRSACCRRYPDS
ncbi:DNA-binding transcriptional ArsR family regulator [Bradyrhizobium sp. LM6.11]